jgi:hypothetical protein
MFSIRNRFGGQIALPLLQSDNLHHQQEMQKTRNAEGSRNKVPNFFITNSLADHHDFHLRLVLHNYLLRIHDNIGDTTYSNNPNDNIINSDSAFSTAAHTYKNVVTHVFASKVEVWYKLVLPPMLGINMALLVHEFQTGWGAIHCHVAAYSNDDTTWARINDGLFSCSVALHNALTMLDLLEHLSVGE